MKILNVILLSTTLLSTSALYAQNEKAPPAYGDNPNLFAVLAHKTGVAVQNTVEKVGAATERGIEKVKPKVGEAWENTRDYSKEQADLALSNTRQGINTAVQKVNDTKDQVIGTSAGNIPITQGRLSQSSTLQNTAPQVITPQVNENSNTGSALPQLPRPIQAQDNATLNDTIIVQSVPVNATAELASPAISSTQPTPQIENQTTKKANYQFDLNTELEKELSTP